MKKLIALLLVLAMTFSLVACTADNTDPSAATQPATQPAPMTIQDIADLIEHMELLTTITKVDKDGVPAYAREFMEEDVFDDLNNVESLYVSDTIYHFMVSDTFVENAGQFSVYIAEACDYLLSYNKDTPEVFSKMQDIFYDAFSTAVEKGAETRYLVPFTRVPEARILMLFYSIDHGTHIITDRQEFSVFDDQQMHKVVNTITNNHSFDYDGDLYMVLASNFDEYVHDQAMSKLRKMTLANMEGMSLAQNRLLCAIREDCWLYHEGTHMTAEELHELRHNVMNNFSIDLGEKLTQFCCYASGHVADYGYECALKIATAAGKLKEESEMRTIMQNAILEVVEHEKFNNWDKIWTLLNASGLIS